MAGRREGYCRRQGVGPRLGIAQLRELEDPEVYLRSLGKAQWP
jgi:hypothetical protein